MKKIKETKEKNWILKSTDTNESLIKIREIADELGINPIIAKLLYNRGDKTLYLQNHLSTWRAKCFPVRF